MSNPIKREFDKASLIKDITDRENIIRRFQTTGYLDRDDAIKKIETKIFTDAELTLATAAKQAQNGSVNLHQADNNLIITNMQFQVDFLNVKLAKLELEEKQNG
ncbi:MAG: hypothetical protein J1E39_02190 [Eubacterium sp.]|nr:hypothetical protein [Eubacterium sp.]